MKFPVISGIIERRLLINYIADPDVVARFLPVPFQPQLYKGRAVVGICLIRLKKIRPKGLPGFIGISSENGAHRFAVQWEEKGELKEGVYIPRRDTSSKLNSLAGGRIFPGKHYHARFHVKESNGHYHLDFVSADHLSVAVDAVLADEWNQNSVFEDLEAASAFFEKGCISYSPKGKGFEGLQLGIDSWKVKPLKITQLRSDFFENETVFPKGSIKPDHALLMENIAHEWRGISDMAGSPEPK
ncbi:hypothetical protein A8C56_03635 [Niabella ginsenosidivorans]|uniref:DUF2071 domain-containing protein n=1 Tax=Niabella ginsenosidivorans TaxID=1176587 RepID=A0A1A9I0D3_9BACT|nr:DUF2071 domain-containing protein [Niabella ginsenosidivorans]ANH80191.1 hypothetical protein A8C56_03635 [Niabella ginsenosidivorans]